MLCPSYRTSDIPACLQRRGPRRACVLAAGGPGSACWADGCGLAMPRAFASKQSEGVSKPP